MGFLQGLNFKRAFFLVFEVLAEKFENFWKNLRFYGACMLSGWKNGPGNQEGCDPCKEFEGQVEEGIGYNEIEKEAP